MRDEVVRELPNAHHMIDGFEEVMADQLHLADNEGVDLDQVSRFLAENAVIERSILTNIEVAAGPVYAEAVALALEVAEDRGRLKQELGL